MERTIYSRYSNERAKRFCIRTDITVDDAGEKKVYKYALTPEGEAHIRHIKAAYSGLEAAYADSGISFCPCEIKDGGASFPFLRGRTLQDMLEDALGTGADETVTEILQEYIRRMNCCGGSEPFTVTEEFAEVFGELSDAECEALRGESGKCSGCAKISDIDMIFSNILVEETVPVGKMHWQVIDYEWSFSFPIPKSFLLYRAFYFAYYQIFYRSGRSLPELLAMADITAEQEAVFRRMEEHFQAYLGAGTLPVRNMQRLMGTKVIPLGELLGGTGGRDGGAFLESEWMKVRKIYCHIDRQEYQDGSMVCSGWAFARTWDGRCLPVGIHVLDQNEREVPLQVERSVREDVVRAMKLRRVTDPVFGFDCVWIAAAGEGFTVRFSLGNKQYIYRMQG